MIDGAFVLGFFVAGLVLAAVVVFLTDALDL